MLAVGSRKQRELLAALLLHANEPVSTGHLVEELWGERPPATAEHTLQVHVSGLRKVLGDAERRALVVTCPGGYMLAVESGRVDHLRFTALVGDGRAALARDEAGAASAALTQALALWRGRPLADVELRGLDRIEAERLAEVRIAALEDRIDADLALGRHAQLVGEIDALVAEYPLRERLRAQLMTALARSGRHAEALAAFQDARRTLVDELGLEPSPALRQLEAAILRHDPDLTVSLPKTEQLPAAQRVSPRRPRAVVAVAALAAFGLAAGIAAAVLAGNGGAPKLAAASTRSSTKVLTTTHSHPRLRNVKAKPRTHRTATTRKRGPSHSSQKAKSVVVAAPAHVTTTVAPATTAAKPAATTAAPKVVHHAKRVTRVKAPSHQTTTTAKAAAPVTLADDFEDGIRNVSLWHVIATGTNVDIVERAGSLELGIGAGALPGGQYNNIDVHYGSQCKLPGDFDARVDYRLLAWPEQSGVYLALNAFFVDAFVERWSQSAEESGIDPLEVYGSWIRPHFRVVNTGDQQGSLRLRRKGGVVTSYYLGGGRWQLIDAARAPGDAVLGLQLSANQGISVAKTVRVAFDNFKAVASAPVCS